MPLRQNFGILLLLQLVILIIHDELVSSDEFHSSINGNLQNDSQVLANTGYTNVRETTIRNTPERKWISQLFSDSRSNFDMNTDVSAVCKKDYELYKLHLQNSSIWAIRMLESSEWPSVGIYSGMNFHLGNWFECMLVSQFNVFGQYCLVNMVYDINKYLLSNSSHKWPDEASSAWNAIELFETKSWKISRKSLNWAMCVPASCQYADIEKSLNHTMYPIFAQQGLHINLKVDSNLCSTRKKEGFPLGFYMFSGFMATILTVVVMSTMYDIIQSKKNVEKLDKTKTESSRGQILTIFSLSRNYRGLVKVNASYRGGVDFMKIIYVCSIILAHRSVFFCGYPKFNPEHMEMYSFNKDHVDIALRGQMLVDVFFMITGFFTFYSGISTVQKNGFIGGITIVILRWIRMVPVFLMVALFVIYVLPHLSEGPYWNYRTQIEVNNCKTTFWDNFFSLSNTINMEKMCLFTSWYVSADIQLTVIGCILMVIIAKNEKVGIFATVMTFIASTVITFIVGYTKQYHAVLPSFMNFLDDPRRSKDFTHFYVTTYMKCSSYILGAGAAIIAKRLKEKKYVFSKKNILWWLAFLIVVKTSALLYTPRLYEFVHEYNRLEQAWNSALLRSIFILPDAILLCAYFTSGWANFHHFCELNVWVPFGRLSYCVFLVHVVIQLYHSASHQVLMPSFSIMPKYWMFLGDLILVGVAAFLLHVVIEAPLNHLSKLVVGSILHSGKKPENKSTVLKSSHTNETFNQNE